MGLPNAFFGLAFFKTPFLGSKSGNKRGLSQKQVKIQNSVPSIGQTFFSIDRKSEEIHHKTTVTFNQFSIPIRSIEKKHSIDRREFSINQDA